MNFQQLAGCVVCLCSSPMCRWWCQRILSCPGSINSNSSSPCAAIISLYLRYVHTVFTSLYSRYLHTVISSLQSSTFLRNYVKWQMPRLINDSFLPCLLRRNRSYHLESAPGGCKLMESVSSFKTVLKTFVPLFVDWRPDTFPCNDFSMLQCGRNCLRYHIHYCYLVACVRAWEQPETQRDMKMLSVLLPFVLTFTSLTGWKLLNTKAGQHNTFILSLSYALFGHLLADLSSGWSPSWETWKPGKVRKFDIGQGKVRKIRKLWFACDVLPQLQ